MVLYDQILDSALEFKRTNGRDPKYLIVSNDILDKLIKIGPQYELVTMEDIRKNKTYKFAGFEIAVFLNAENRVELV